MLWMQEWKKDMGGESVCVWVCVIEGFSFNLKRSSEMVYFHNFSDFSNVPEKTGKKFVTFISAQTDSCMQEIVQKTCVWCVCECVCACQMGFFVSLFAHHFYTVSKWLFSDGQKNQLESLFLKKSNQEVHFFIHMFLTLESFHLQVYWLSPIYFLYQFCKKST